MNAAPSRQTVIVVTGPTATGKTELGAGLAQWLDTEVISADSQLVYRHLDIGTAKPTPEETRGVLHAMIDVAEPTEEYSVADYRAEASRHLTRLHAAGKVPVIVGGTGFYIRALVQGGYIPGVPPNTAFREEMARLADERGTAVLHQRLSRLDPRRAGEIHPNDRFRIIRALEIIEATGEPVPNPEVSGAYRVIWTGLTYEDRSLLDERINRRIDAMLAAGWLDEVRILMERFGPDAHALTVAHGYPEWVRHLQGELPFAEALEQVRINIRQYSRRQLTWFRRVPDMWWLPRDHRSPEEAFSLAQAHVSAGLRNTAACKKM